MRLLALKPFFLEKKRVAINEHRWYTYMAMEITGRSTPRYRPWEQKDLLSRLQTFKPRSWYAKPAQISAVTCARHGWINSGPDNLKCEFCGECLDLPIRPKWSFQDVQKASQEYAGRLVSAHTDSCPWRDTVCDAKLGRFPKLPARDVYVDFEQRYAHLDKLAQLPPLTEQAVDKIKESVRDDMAVLLKRQRLRLAGMQAQSRLPAQSMDSEPLQTLTGVSHGLAEQGSDAFVKRACLLAACGWDACKLSSLVTTDTNSPNPVAALPPGTYDMQQSVLGCSMCGATVGLWSFAQQPVLEADEESMQPKLIGQAVAQATPAPPASRENTGSAAGDESTPARRDSIKRDLSRTIAGGPLVSPDSAGTPEKPFHRPAFGSSSHMPHTAASTSRPFGSPLPQAPFGSPFPYQPEGSVIGSAMGSPPRHAPFGSPLQAPAFGSGSISPSNSFANEAFFTPAAALNPRGQHAAPGSTTGVGDAAFDTSGSVYATPVSRFGTPSSGFGSPTFQTPAGQLGHRSAGLQPRGTPASPSQYGTPAAGTATPGLNVVRPSSGAAQTGTPGDGAQQNGAAGGPFGAPAFGGGAALPAFGMAVFKSPPPSRSPSADQNQLAPLVASAAAAPTTAVDPVAGPSAGTADVVGLGVQPSGSKRKREGTAGTPEVDVPSSSKQIRLEGATAERDAGAQGTRAPAFHLLKSHKSFCPWVAAGTADTGTSEPVCGWQWCLSSLAAHWDKDQDPSESTHSPLQGQSQRLRQALAAIGTT